ncbi:hypothetical protein V1511DRAFT_456573 [Dipodascopsis uninucleata]
MLDSRGFGEAGVESELSEIYRTMSTADVVTDSDDEDPMPLVSHEPAVEIGRRNKYRTKGGDGTMQDREDAVGTGGFILRDRRKSIVSGGSNSQPSNNAPVEATTNSGHRGTASRSESFLVNIADEASRDHTRMQSAESYGVMNEYMSHSAPRSRDMSTVSLDDVCVPLESAKFGDESTEKSAKWPDTSALDEWVINEQQAISGEMPEVIIVDGRPRLKNPPVEGPSYFLEDNIPSFQVSKRRMNENSGFHAHSGLPERNNYKFTYFREDLEKTIHAQSISGLLAHGLSFSELFPPSNDIMSSVAPSIITAADDGEFPVQDEKSGGITLNDFQSRPQSAPPEQTKRPQAYNDFRGSFKGRPGFRPANSIYEPRERPYPFWLDVMDPTDAEMKVLSKAFGIHPLTTEDITMEETREKVELFRTYYLVCFRSFEIEPFSTERDKRMRRRDPRYKKSAKFGSRGRLVPVNMYLVVFRDGVISFHFRPTPHPANVRRRIRQLRDYVTVSADWISYAIIDNITDAFAPLISEIEEEVQDIDTEILEMHSGDSSEDSDEYTDEDADADEDDSLLGHKLHTSKRKDGDVASLFSTKTTPKYDVRNKGDMLRRIGECRKQVLGLMRLLGYKADVIKGFAKRCTEQWDVAPRSEIGLYLGDIQDHLITMVQNLTHYEKLLSRSHSNYLAQINIEMTQVNNDTNDVLGRLTILGTIVLPMNIITGLWGMNVYVPGQDQDGLSWFYSITLGLIIFGFTSFIVAKKIYGVA